MNIYEILNTRDLIQNPYFTLYYQNKHESLSTSLKTTPVGLWCSWDNYESIISVIKGMPENFPIDYYLQVPVLFTMMDLAFDFQDTEVRT